MNQQYQQSWDDDDDDQWPEWAVPERHAQDASERPRWLWATVVLLTLGPPLGYVLARGVAG